MAADRPQRVGYASRPHSHPAVSPRSIAHVTYLVRDYDEAIAWFTGALGFRLLEDAPRGPEKRWVLVAPDGGGTALLLARAATPAQREGIGDQGSGRVFLFLHTDDFRRDHAELAARGVRFVEAPREEPYGTVAVFVDLYGNRWDLLQPTSA
jgi:catechol 2,3-dioxygenase-like lactoylglutathione lyase family enzyme